MGKLYQKFLSVIGWMIVGLTTMLIVIVFYNVASRFIFHSTVAWTEEIARFLFIWLTFLGAVLVNDKYEHMNLDVVVTSLPPKAGKLIQLISTTIACILFIILMVGGYKVVLRNMDWRSSALEIPYAYVYMIEPICCVIMAGQSIVRICKIVRKGGDGL